MNKKCNSCKKLKSLDEFYKQHNGYPRSCCKGCWNKRVYQWQKTAGKENKIRSLKKWFKSSKGKIYCSQLRKTPASRYNSLKRSARRRGLKCTLTLKEYTNLILQSCNYCEGPLPAMGIGLDRIDSLKGYTPFNVLPCCGECNRIRSDVYTVAEAKKIGVALKEIRAARSLMAKQGSY